MPQTNTPRSLKISEKKMGNSPTDKGRDFIKSGMTLITQIDSDKYLKQTKKEKKSKDVAQQTTSEE